MTCYYNSTFRRISSHRISYFCTSQRYIITHIKPHIFLPTSFILVVITYLYAFFSTHLFYFPNYFFTSYRIQYLSFYVRNSHLSSSIFLRLHYTHTISDPFAAARSMLVASRSKFNIPDMCVEVDSSNSSSNDSWTRSDLQSKSISGMYCIYDI